MQDINGEISSKILEDLNFANMLGEKAVVDFAKHIAETFPNLYGFFYGFVNDEENFLFEKLEYEDRAAIVGYFSYLMRCLEDSNKEVESDNKKKE